MPASAKLSPEDAAAVQFISTLVRERYGKQLLAADAWDVDPTMLSRIVGGKRSPRAWVPRIAEIEGIPPERFYEASGSTPAARQPGFAFVPDDPARMATQLDEWFSELPTEGATTERVVRAVMRTIRDEHYRTTPPPEAWRFVMVRLEGLRPSEHRAAG